MSNSRIIALVNRKGGTGKTTSCAYLAMCLQQADKTVTGIDADPDSTWLEWGAGGVLPYPVFKANCNTLSDVVAGLEGYVVIDTPPNDPELIFDAAELADEVIVPLAPTAPDVNRLAKTLATVAKVEKMRGQPLGSVLLTKWDKQLNISQETAELLQEKGAPLLDAKIRDLTRYTAFKTPSYLLEYDKVLHELGVL